MRSEIVLITGGAGFIGSHLVDLWMKIGAQVIVIDDLSRGTLKNLENHLDDDSFFFIEQDLANPKLQPALEKVLADFRPTLILHFAAINGTEHFYDHSFQVATTNSAVTQNIITALMVTKNSNPDWYPKFIYASTSEVYGDPDVVPTPEFAGTDIRINEKRDSYSAAKLVGEFYSKLGCEKVSVPWLILRIFNVYGPRMVSTKYGQVIPEFIQRTIDGERPLKIIGSGQHTRSFNHVSDFVSILDMLVRKNYWNEVLNIGNPNEISINDLAEKVLNSMGLPFSVEHTEARAGDHLRRCPDITKMLDAIGGYSFRDLDDGISELCEFYK